MSDSLGDPRLRHTDLGRVIPGFWPVLSISVWPESSNPGLEGHYKDNLDLDKDWRTWTGDCNLLLAAWWPLKGPADLIKSSATNQCLLYMDVGTVY